MREAASSHRALLAAAVAAIFAAGAEQGVTQGALWQMLADFGVREAAGGGLVLLFGVGIVFSTLSMGFFVQRLGERRMMIFGAGCAALAWAGHALLRSYFAGLPLFLIGGIGHGLLLGAATIAAGRGPRATTHRRIALVQAFYMVGLAAGGLLGGYADALNALRPGGFLEARSAWAAAYGLSSLLSLLALACALAAGAPKERAREQPLSLRGVKAMMAIPGVAAMVAIIFLDIGAEAAIGAWLSSYLQTVRGADAHLGGWAVSLVNGGVVIGRVLLGFWSPPVTLPRVLVIASAGAAALCVALIFTPAALAPVVAVLTGILFAGIVPLGLAIVRDRCPDDLADPATSIALGVGCLGSLVFPPVVGVAAQLTGSFPVAFALPAALFVCVFLLARGEVRRLRR